MPKISRPPSIPVPLAVQGILASIWHWAYEKQKGTLGGTGPAPPVVSAECNCQGPAEPAGGYRCPQVNPEIYERPVYNPLAARSGE